MQRHRDNCEFALRQARAGDAPRQQRAQNSGNWAYALILEQMQRLTKRTIVAAEGECALKVRRGAAAQTADEGFSLSPARRCSRRILALTAESKPPLTAN